MSVSVSHWSGRLGNNIQQVANCIMAAEKHGGVYEQTLDHDIISKFVIPFGNGEANGYGRFYSWEALTHCEKGIYEGGNETGLDVDHIFATKKFDEDADQSNQNRPVVYSHKLLPIPQCWGL